MQLWKYIGVAIPTVIILAAVATALICGAVLYHWEFATDVESVNRRLCEAVMRHDAKAVEAYLAGGADVGCHCRRTSRRVEQDWTTLLHKAAGDPDMMALLLRHGADPNGRNSLGETALWEVVRMSEGPMEVRCARLLIDAGTDVNARVNEYGSTAVHKAASSDSLQCLRLLLEGGGNPNQQDRNGNTPMHVAGSLTKRLRSQTVQILLDHGADPSLLNHSGDRADEPLPYLRNSQ
jgi:hypothetical protein